jgi:hypothetical protein
VNQTIQARFGRGFVLYLTLLPTLVVCGWYIFSYMPGQREYYVNMRFRALAATGDHITAKLDALGTGLDGAREKYGKSEARFEEYLAAMLPDFQSGRRQCLEDQKKASIQFVPDGSVLFASGDACYSAPLQQVVAPFAGDELFDDVLLATDDGTVLFQRSQSSPRLASLSPFLESKTTEQKGVTLLRNPESHGDGKKASLLRRIALDGTHYQLLALPVRIREKTLVLGGLIKEAQLESQVRELPPAVLIWIIAPLITAFLTGSFLKLALLRPTGRLGAADFAILSVTTLLAVSFLTFLLLLGHYHKSEVAARETELRNFAQSLNEALIRNFRSSREMLVRVDSFARQLEESGKLSFPGCDASDLADLWVASCAQTVRRLEGIQTLDLDFFFWTGPDGRQVQKWTTRRFNTPAVSLRQNEDFQRAVQKSYWLLGTPTAQDSRQFLLNLAISPNTSEPVLLMTVPSKRTIRRAGGGSIPATAAHLIMTPRPLLYPVLPPDVGFAVVQPDGKALFHSRPDRMLTENLLTETSAGGLIRQAFSSRASAGQTASYRGKPHQFYVQPFQNAPGVPWAIVVFREIEPLQKRGWQIWLDVVTLFILLLLVPATLIGVLLLAQKSLYRRPWRETIHHFLGLIWPCPERYASYCRLGVSLVLLLILHAGAMWLMWPLSYASSGKLLLLSFASPSVALVLYAYFQLKHGTPADGNKNWRLIYVTNQALTLVLVSVLPVTGFFIASYNFESAAQLQQWQHLLFRNVAEDRRWAAAAVDGSLRLTPGAREVLRKIVFPERPPSCRDSGRPFYCEFHWTRIYQTERAETAPLGRWAHFLTAVLKPLFTPQMNLGRTNGAEAGIAWGGMPDRPSSFRLIYNQPVNRALVEGLTLESSIEDLPPPGNLIGWLLFLVALCVWVHVTLRRLFLFDFQPISIPVLEEVLSEKSPCHLLVLGLPRTGKDGAVMRGLRGKKVRINLDRSEITADWRKEQLDRVVAELSAEAEAAPRVMTAAASQPSSQTAVVSKAGSDDECDLPHWVLLSNLESIVNDKAKRDVVVGLLDELTRMQVNCQRVWLVISSVVDPFYHFNSILAEEKKQTSDTILPEIELQAWAHALYRFRKVRVPSVMEKPEPWVTEEAWQQELWCEAKHHPALREIGRQIAIDLSFPEARRTREQVLEYFCERALALYEFLFAACTRPEKLMLIQLAQTGLVNPLRPGVLQELIRKGLIVMDPKPRIMNESFRRYLEDAEKPETIRAWEREAGESLWPVIRNVLLILLAVCLVLLVVTQDQAIQSVTTIATAVGGLMALGIRALEFLSNRKKTDATAA